MEIEWEYKLRETTSISGNRMEIFAIAVIPKGTIDTSENMNTLVVQMNELRFMERPLLWKLLPYRLPI